MQNKEKEPSHDQWDGSFLSILPSELLLELIQTFGANTLAVEKYDVVGVVAENAGRVVLLENDTVIIGENLNGILYFDVHCLSDFDRKNDSSQLVYFSDHSGGFHNF